MPRRFCSVPSRAPRASHRHPPRRRRLTRPVACVCVCGAVRVCRIHRPVKVTRAEKGKRKAKHNTAAAAGEMRTNEDVAEDVLAVMQMSRSGGGP